ncbi:MAG: GNAT family N-acetyltransferase [Mycobacteriales bacterium]
MAVTVLTSAAEVLLATDHDPYVRGSLRSPEVGGWAGHGAVAWRATDAEERVSYLMSLGEPAAVAALIADLVGEITHNTRVTLPRGTPPLLPAWVAIDGTDWEFWWADAPLAAQPREREVVDVHPEEVASLLAAASPTASAQADDPHVRRWVGVRGPAGLLACAADTSGATGVGHLSSIATHPSARGQGLGAAVTAALARRMFEEGADVVTLGMYADNAAGFGLYRHLGMRNDHHFTSGPLQVRSRW